MLIRGQSWPSLYKWDQKMVKLELTKDISLKKNSAHIEENAVIKLTAGQWDCPLDNCPKLAVWQLNNRLMEVFTPHKDSSC